jgi:hypothetical protein
MKLLRFLLPVGGLLAPVILLAEAPAAPTIASPADRIAARTFPSVYQAWSPADNLKEDKWTTVCRHDLVFNNPEFFGLKWAGKYSPLATEFSPDSIAKAKKLRAELLRKNPDLIMLGALHYHDVHKGSVPDDSPWLQRKNGKPIPKKQDTNYYMVDVANPEMQAQIVLQCRVLMDTGVVDGIFFDWWEDDDAHLQLTKTVRAAIGDKALIMGNTNERIVPRTSSYLNGYFMECFKSDTAADWEQIANALQYGEKHNRSPHIDCMETWWHKSRQDLNRMRATTTLSLTLSDGYCLFCDPNSLPTPDHEHDWYDYWEKSLGKPTAKVVQQGDGSFRREFDRGTVVYNPMGNHAMKVSFETPRERLSTREIGKEFTVPGLDGDLFLLPLTGGH